MTNNAITALTEDIIARVSGIAPDSPIAHVRAQRPEVVRYAQNSYDTLFAPAEPGGLTLAERIQAALRVAVLEDHATMITHYQALLAQSNGSDENSAPRMAAILRHVDLLTQEPAAATPAHLTALQAVGLSTRAIVTLAQLIAFVSFQVRTVVGLQLLQGNSSPSSPGHSAASQVSTPTNLQNFTLNAIGWDAWLDTLDLAEATPEQIAVLEESTPTAKTSPYYLLLIQEVDVLRARSRLYNAIMYGPRGLARADRELAAVAVSRINGCPYCASVHAQRFAQLTKQPALVQRLWEEGVTTMLEPRPRALVDYAVKLTSTPSQMTPDDLVPLRQIGLSDWEILDLTHVVAMFAWANRLMQTLGEPVAAGIG